MRLLVPRRRAGAPVVGALAWWCLGAVAPLGASGGVPGARRASSSGFVVHHRQPGVTPIQRPLGPPAALHPIAFARRRRSDDDDTASSSDAAARSPAETTNRRTTPHRLSSHLYARPRRRRVERHGVVDTVKGVLVTSVLVTAVSFAPWTVDEALASYAPSSAAVNSQIPAKKLDLERLEALTPQKALQRERALGKVSVSDLLSELDDRLAQLQDQVRELEDVRPGDRRADSASESEEPELLTDLRKKLAEQQAEREKRRQDIERDLAQKRRFEAELRKRAETLRKLEEQPAWFNYAAAAAASVVSTVAMHPVDTVKTRLMSSKSQQPGPSSNAAAASAPPTFGDDDDDDDASASGGGPAADRVVVVNGAVSAPAHATNGAAPGGGSGGVSSAGRGDALASWSAAAKASASGVALLAASSRSSDDGAASTEYYERRQTGPGTAVLDPPGGSPASPSSMPLTVLEAAAAAPDVVALEDRRSPEAEEAAAAAASDDDDDDDDAANPVESWLSLYVGVGGNVAKEALPSALYLGVYEAVKSALLKTPQGAAVPLAVYLVAGGAGEICGSFVRAPAEAVKSLVQAGVTTSFADACGYIVATDVSRKRVARAWSASVWRDVPMGAIQIALFELLKTYILNSPSISIDVNTLQAEAMLGAIGGLVGSVVTTPLDLTTTRIITSADEDVRGSWTIFRDILDAGGVPALFEGAAQRGLYWAPAIGIFLSAYCSFRQFAAENPAAHRAIDAITELF